ncbi:MAG: hypothetical protein P9M14_06890 [Candidatus Alcyoniella australis]|nr:hypothetical protein [Candidatus Alcyoniella australis]
MALNKAQLTARLTEIFRDTSADATPASKAAQIADAVDEFVRTALVSTTVTVAGVTVGTGSATGTGAGGVS